jgi:hypothetical protein
MAGNAGEDLFEPSEGIDFDALTGSYEAAQHGCRPTAEISAQTIRAMVAWIRMSQPRRPLKRFFEEVESGGLHLFMSMLNVGETFYILAKRKGMPVAEQFLHDLPVMPIHIVIPGKRNHGCRAHQSNPRGCLR